MGVVTQIKDLDNTATRVRPYGVKDRFILKPDLALFRNIAAEMNYCSAI